MQMAPVPSALSATPNGLKDRDLKRGGREWNRELAKSNFCWHSHMMSVEGIEQKLAELTARVERLEERSKPAAKPMWREALGLIPDDSISREAARLGEEWRKSEGVAE